MELKKRKEIKALVVDDMASMRMLIRSVLNRMGIFDIAEASNGRDALKYLSNSTADILICDWNMPGMSGLEVVQAVRAQAELLNLPVLMVTAERSQTQVRDAIAAGVTGYVSKPFTPAILQLHIQECLKCRR
jgi:two-component system chemotaxis response regulator CheY